jgi:ribosomal protein S18 acetylase RimI-like enzyme
VTLPDQILTIEVAREVTKELVTAVANLIPQLSASSAPPSAAELAEIVESPGATLFVARLGAPEGAPDGPDGPDGAADPDGPAERPESGDPSPIVGMLTFITYRIPTGVHGVVEDVVVESSARGAGAGEALLQAALDAAREAGVRHVDLTSRSSREAANRLYVRMGFAARETNVYRYRHP